VSIAIGRLQLPQFEWSTERLLIALIAAGWLALITPLPSSLHGTAVILTLALLSLDVVLGIRTGWLAFRMRSAMDERQLGIRDEAYRVAYQLMRTGIVIMLVAGVFATGVNALAGTAALAGISPRYLVACLELLVVLPTAALAWNRVAGQGLHRSPARYLSLLVVPLVLAGWGLLVSTFPAKASVAPSSNVSFSIAGSSCEQLVLHKEIAAGFGGGIGLHVEVCWNGQKAFAVGDPAFPLPPNVLPDQDLMPREALSMPELTACAPARSETDFSVVAQRCSEQNGPDGTMTLIVDGTVSSLPGGLLKRTLEAKLIVDRNGKILEAG
jgi:hypothetical protein